MRFRSLALGCFLAALAPGVVLVAYLLLSGVGGGDIADLVSGVSLVLAISFTVAAIPTLLLGLPYVLWLQSRSALTWLNVCTGSMALGALTMAILSWAMVWNNPVPDAWSYLLGAGFGLAGGLGFCVGATPNNSFKPTPLRGAA